MLRYRIMAMNARHDWGGTYKKPHGSDHVVEDQFWAHNGRVLISKESLYSQHWMSHSRVGRHRVNPLTGKSMQSWQAQG